MIQSHQSGGAFSTDMYGAGGGEEIGWVGGDKPCFLVALGMA